MSIIPFIIFTILIHGYIKNINLYECFVEGAKEGFKTTVRIMPYLIAVFVAIGIFKRSSAMNIFVSIFTPITKIIGLPKELIPLIIMRPISGSGSLALVKNITCTYGADSFIARVAATMMGSAETIFYTMAIYFGAIGIKKSRHTLTAALLSHIGAIAASLIICNIFFDK
ncbi:spore maturation protein [Abyssisolibacter fermentans]|uniref:spore maturation protein n=1 Tax=Abyssisolibacter fermentans TaxID=1766203 RepID=UPI00083725CB|nr:nucleoside recognition domain-containing protein [Abyssisolibacter fermentans]